MPKKKSSAQLLDLPPEEMDEEALQREILRRLGVENVPTHVSAWLPTASLIIPDEESVREPGWLVQSIKMFGMMQAPSVVRVSTPSEEEPLYEVIAGRRRTLAARILGLPGIAVEVYAFATPQLSAMIALTENAQRAKAWRAEVKYLRLLISQGVGLSERELITCGFARQGLKERLKMARLPPDLLDQIIAGQVPQTLARKLVALTPSQLTRISEAARSQPLTRDLVKQALKAQMTASMPSMPTFAWDIPSPPAATLSGAAEAHPGSLQDLLDALQAFRQGPDYHRVQEAHLLVQALMQQVEVAIREAPLPAQAS
jgi:ParB-like chromosome segregation protein Spo0J